MNSNKKKNLQSGKPVTVVQDKPIAEEDIGTNTFSSEEEYLDNAGESNEDEEEIEKEEPGQEDDETVEEIEELPEDEEIINYLNNESPRALLVTCIDPGFRESFADFGKKEFGNFISLTIPGGIGPLTLELLPKSAETLRRQIKFILKETGIKEVVLISHDDCKWYHFNEGYFTGPLKEQQKNDLLSAKKIIEERFEGVQVICYLAEIKDDSIEFVPFD